jgi:hypothetical protein
LSIAVCCRRSGPMLLYRSCRYLKMFGTGQIKDDYFKYIIP